MNLIDLGKQVMDAVRKRSTTAQAEAFLSSGEGRVMEWSEGKPENAASTKSQGIGLRVIEDGKLGFASSNSATPEGLTWLADASVTACRLTGKDPNLDLPKPVPQGPSVDLEQVDPTMSQGSFEERSTFLSTIEEKVKKRDKRLTKVLRASYREGRQASAVVSSTGIATAAFGTSFSFSLACVAMSGTETQVGYGFQAVRHRADLKIDWVIDRTIEQSLSLLGGKQIPSGRYDLVLDPLVGAEMLELIATAMRADQVLKGRSFLAGQVGKKIGASCMSIVDDARLVRGLGSSLFDAEGVPTRTTDMIKEGVLQGYFYDSTNARRAKTASTGNAGRSSYKGLPEPEASNFYIKPGQKPPEELIGEIQSGIYVRNVMGLHTVDTVSGEFSLGIMGEHIEKGKRTHGVRGVTIAGLLTDILKDVEAVGNDLEFAGSVGSPTLWIKGVSVGGS